MTPAALRRHVPLAAASVIALGWVVAFSRYAAHRNRLFLTHAFDMGQMIQGVWKIRSGRAPESTITGLHMLGDHARVILYPLAFIVPPSGTALVVLQAVAIGSCIVAVFFLARDRDTPMWVGIACAGFLAVSTPLQWMSLFEFHPEVIALPLLLWALVAATRENWFAYWPLIGVALLCREDVAIAVVLVGVAVWLDQRKPRVAIVTAAVGAVWLGIATLLMRSNNPYGLSVFEERYGWLGDGPIDAAWQLVSDFPDSLYRQPVLPALLVVLVALYGAAALAAFAPLRLVWLPLPLIVANCFSSLTQQRSPYFHYTYLVYPFLALCMVRGMQRLAAVDRRPVQLASAGVAVILAILTTVWFSPFTEVKPALGAYVRKHTYAKPAKLRNQFKYTHPRGYLEEARAAVDVVSDDESVSAGGTLVPHLAERREVYMWPNPFYPMWFGEFLTEEPPLDTRARLPRRPPKWVVHDRAHGAPQPTRVATELMGLLESHYEKLYAGEFVSVWRLRDSDEQN